MRKLQILFYYIRSLSPLDRLRTFFLISLGARVGSGTLLPWSTEMDWPQRVRIGVNCALKTGISFHFDGPWGTGDAIVIGDDVFLGRGVEFNITHSVEIGNDTLVGSGTKFIDHDHGMALGASIRRQPSSAVPIAVGQDCWIGSSCIILKGVRIGSGAVIGAGSVVITSVPEREIWVGIPARKIGIRS